MFNKILVVCVGNICRSPTAEYLLKNKLPNKHIASAGIGTQRNGLADKPADKMAACVALTHGLDLSAHRARQLTSALCKEYDLILVMEKRHLNSVRHLAPEASGKTMLLGHWLKNKEIADPYQRSEEIYQLVFDLIEQSVNEWVKKLK